jgi:hypothetical protein
LHGHLKAFSLGLRKIPENSLQRNVGCVMNPDEVKNKTSEKL